MPPKRKRASSPAAAPQRLTATQTDKADWHIKRLMFWYGVSSVIKALGFKFCDLELQARDPKIKQVVYDPTRRHFLVYKGDKVEDSYKNGWQVDGTHGACGIFAMFIYSGKHKLLDGLRPHVDYVPILKRVLRWFRGLVQSKMHLVEIYEAWHYDEDEWEAIGDLTPFSCYGQKALDSLDYILSDDRFVHMFAFAVSNARRFRGNVVDRDS